MSGGCHCEEMKGGSRVNNPWVEHVKKYAKENNMTYACAIPEAKKTYTKVDKDAMKYLIHFIERIVIYSIKMKKYRYKYNGQVSRTGYKFNIDLSVIYNI